MSFNIKNNIVFLDSLQFLNTSLNNQTMSLEDKLFKQTMKRFPNCEIRDLKGKNVYPCDWVDDYRKCSYPRLPPREAFYSSLNANQKGKGDGHISIAEHLHAKYI